MKENLVKIVEREKFTVKNSPIIQFKDLKDNVYSEVVFSKKYTGIQVCLTNLILNIFLFSIKKYEL